MEKEDDFGDRLAERDRKEDVNRFIISLNDRCLDKGFSSLFGMLSLSALPRRLRRVADDNMRFSDFWREIVVDRDRCNSTLEEDGDIKGVTTVSVDMMRVDFGGKVMLYEKEICKFSECLYIRCSKGLAMKENQDGAYVFVNGNECNIRYKGDVAQLLHVVSKANQGGCYYAMDHGMMMMMAVLMEARGRERERQVCK